MSINREMGFLTELLVSNDMATVVDNMINSSYLTGRNKQVFNKIRQHQDAYGKVPSIDYILSYFPNLELMKKPNGEYGTEETLQFWCDQLRERKKHNTIVDHLEEVIDKMNNDTDTEKAYSLIKRLVMKVENEIVLSDRIKINENVDKRKQEYLKREKSGGMTGIPTYIDLIDKNIGGFNAGELITFMGFTGIGKSWMEIIMAVNQAKNGYRVLFFTTEMSKEMVMRRIDAVWNGFNYSLFTKGQLHPKDKERYFKYLDEMANTPDDEIMLVVEQATGGLSQIGAKIDQYKPDIVYIDGAYLLQDEEGEEDNWAGIVRVWRGLHRLCLVKKVPIIATTQSKDETNASIKSLSFAKALSNDCDVLAVLEQDSQQKHDREISVRFLKVREGDTLSVVHMNWDFNKMDYSCIYQERGASKEEDEVPPSSAHILID